MSSEITRGVVEAIRGIFAEADMEGSLCARVAGHPEIVEIDIDGQRVLPTASLYKLPLVLGFVRAWDAGRIDPREPVLLQPGARTRGATGLSVLQDPVTMSWRDLARSAVALSDNAAGDALLERIGGAEVEEALAAAGARSTRIRGGAALTLDLLDREHGGGVLDPADVHVGPESAALDIERVSVSTAADMLRLVDGVWTDRAASAQGCAFVREVLGQQVWAHRFAGAFSYPGVRLAAKTGSLGPLRHEAGAVTHRAEPAVLISVMTLSARRDASVPRADEAVGAAADEAVQFLRQFL